MSDITVTIESDDDIICTVQSDSDITMELTET